MANPVKSGSMPAWIASAAAVLAVTVTLWSQNTQSITDAAQLRRQVAINTKFRQEWRHIDPSRFRNIPQDIAVLRAQMQRLHDYFGLTPRNAETERTP